MTLPTLPTPPSRNDPSNFSDQADAFLGALPAWGDAANALEQSLQLVATTGTSTTGATIGTGSKGFFTQPGKAWVVGAFVYVVSAASPTNLMMGQVTAYDAAAGTLTVNAAYIQGNGTFSAWIIGLSVPIPDDTVIVHKSGAETITGLKTFTAGMAISGGAPSSAISATDPDHLTTLAQVGALIVGATPQATTSVTGLVRLATSADVIAGTDAAKPVTPSTLHAGKMVFGAAQTTTSGTGFDFTGIPAWVRRVTVVFNRVSLNGSANLAVRLGTSGGVLSSGYSSTFSYLVNDSNANSGATTSEFGMFGGNPANLFSGTMSLYLIDSSANIWVSSHSAATATSTALGGGAVTLPGALTSIRITTSNGTDLFDSGSVNIVWE